MEREIKNEKLAITGNKSIKHTPNKGDDYDRLLETAGILIEGMYDGDEEAFGRVKALRQGFALRRDIFADAERQIHLRMSRIGN